MNEAEFQIEDIEERIKETNEVLINKEKFDSRMVQQAIEDIQYLKQRKKDILLGLITGEKIFQEKKEEFLRRILVEMRYTLIIDKQTTFAKARDIFNEVFKGD